MILERFSLECPILYLVNEDIFPSALVKGRSFFDFVARSDEDKVRTAMETIKGWGVNERGSPSDGGFGFNRFKIFLKGRNSRQEKFPHSIGLIGSLFDIFKIKKRPSNRCTALTTPTYTGRYCHNAVPCAPLPR